ncbi:long-chain fatty alcohol dehydrogenase [Xylariomycetidae sp. FL2044]|nr:long-chain fatty alcohol dehydrogenase [Xylariomycetidae sp. FL2044]
MSDPVECSLFQQSHWDTLFALLDAAVPSLVSDADLIRDDTNASPLCVSERDIQLAYEPFLTTFNEPPTINEFRQYLAARPLDNPKFVAIIKELINGIPPRLQIQLVGLLGFLATRVGGFAGAHTFRSLREAPLQTRHAALQSWQKAWFPLWPALSRSFLSMAKVGWTQSDRLLLGLSNYDASEITASAPGPTIDFQFIKFDPGEHPAVLETDVVIIGSGCGGGVCAKVLAEAGRKVLVADKGYYLPPSQLPVPVESSSLLYEGGLQTVDGATTVLTGSCWGGGGTVNWSASLQTQDMVRQEWAEQGLSFFATDSYQENLDRVCDFMGVSAAHISHNHRNRVLLDGSEKLGWKAKVSPQNTGGHEHSCGHCSFGCRSAEKQGPAVSWLPAAKNAGALFIEGLDVSEILFGEYHSKTATGVRGKWTSSSVSPNSGKRTHREVEIKAKSVIVACGTLHSPLLLMRSGLKNPQIGKNLYMHPTGNFVAAFREVIDGWNGSILTSVVSEFENLDGKGHGVKIVASVTLPHMVAFTLPWHSALQYKIDVLKFRHMAPFCCIARDRDTGSVTPDPDGGGPMIHYTPSKFDRASIVTGLVATAKLCYIQGAVELFPFVLDMPSFKSQKPFEERKLDDKDFVQWLSRLERENLNPAGNMFTAAHLMGTCRMSISPESGVVDDRGRVWGTENVYVADASVFPSASGVNPMITTMAIADRVAQWLATFWDEHHNYY